MLDISLECELHVYLAESQERTRILAELYEQAKEILQQLDGSFNQQNSEQLPQELLGSNGREDTIVSEEGEQGLVKKTESTGSRCQHVESTEHNSDEVSVADYLSTLNDRQMYDPLYILQLETHPNVSINRERYENHQEIFSKDRTFVILFHRQRTVWDTREVIHVIGITPHEVRKEVNKELQRHRLMRFAVFKNPVQKSKIQNSKETGKESLFSPEERLTEGGVGETRSNHYAFHWFFNDSYSVVQSEQFEPIDQTVDWL